MSRQPILAALLAGVAMLLGGCAAPMTYHVPKAEAVSLPAIGAVSFAAPGDRMLVQGVNRTFDAITLPVVVRLQNLTGSVDMPAGTYRKFGTRGPAELFFPLAEGAASGSVPVGSGGEYINDLAVINLSSKPPVLCAIAQRSTMFCTEGQPFTRTTTTALDAETLQRTLIYSGKIGNRLSLAYREFGGGMARAAFSNTAEYDLSESSVLVYQGARIEVLEASNQGIRYRVLRNFNEAP